jgi:hypothetical protein
VSGSASRIARWARGLDRPEQDGVDADAAAGEVDAEVASELYDRRLPRGERHRCSGRARVGEEGGRVDDRASRRIGGEHPADTVLAGQEDGRDVRVEHAPPGVEVGAQRASVSCVHEPDVVVEHVDPTASSDDLLEHGRDLLLVGEIGAQLVRTDVVFDTVDSDDESAFSCEAFGNCLADRAGRARDHTHLAREPPQVSVLDSRRHDEQCAPPLCRGVAHRRTSSAIGSSRFTSCHAWQLVLTKELGGGSGVARGALASR